MRDLNATMFYKAKFIATAAPEEDLLWKLVNNIRNWITYKLNRDGHQIVDAEMRKWTFFKIGTKLYDLEGNNAFFAESACHEADGLTSWACRIVEKPQPEPGHAIREWTTEIGYRALAAGRAEISYVVTYQDAGGFIGPCMAEPGISVPRVIRRLLDNPALTCTIGDIRLSTAPQLLQAGGTAAFTALLQDVGRELPLLFLSPLRQDDGSYAAPLDAQAVAAAVVGNALVYYAEDPQVLQELQDSGAAACQCGSGIVRVFLPQPAGEHSGAAYRYCTISAEQIAEQGEEYVLRMLRRALAQDVHFYESLFRLRNCRALIEADKHKEKIDEAKRQLAEMQQKSRDVLSQSEAEANEALTAFLEESEKRQEAEDLAQDYMSRCESLERDLHGLRTTLDAYHSRMEQISLIESANQALHSIDEYPNTPEKIVRYFATVYPDRIVFTDRCYRSLKDCITKGEILWDIFYHMVHELFDLLQENPATAYLEFKQRTGWHCSSGEGPMTRKDAKLMRGYEDEYMGQEIDIEAHIKNGVKESDPNFVRIHFDYKPKLCPQIIVGHCGLHIDNFSTKKVK